MKRWLGLFLVLVAATAIVAAVIAVRMQPSDLERRHATIRVGMTYQEVYEIVDPRGPLPEVFPSPTGTGCT